MIAFSAVLAVFTEYIRARLEHVNLNADLQLAQQAGLRRLARLDLAAGKLPATGQVDARPAAGGEHPAVAFNDGCSDINHQLIPIATIANHRIPCRPRQPNLSINSSTPSRNLASWGAVASLR